MEVTLKFSLDEVREVYHVARELTRYLVGEPGYENPLRLNLGLNTHDISDEQDDRLLGAALCAEGISLWHLNAGSAKGRWKESDGKVTVSYRITLFDSADDSAVNYNCVGSASVDMDPSALHGASLVAYGIYKIIEGRGENSEGMFDAALETEPRLVIRPSDISCALSYFKC